VQFIGYNVYNLLVFETLQLLQHCLLTIC